MFRGASLLKVGVILMALALGVVICAVLLSVALRGEGGGAAEVATKILGERPWHSFGAEGNAAEKSSSENEPLGNSSSGEGAQRVAAASEAEGSSDPRSAEPQSAGQRKRQCHAD